MKIAKRYEWMLKAEDSEIDSLRKEWQSATVKLIDYLAEGDEALNEASLEMESFAIICLRRLGGAGIAFGILGRARRGKLLSS